jgi:hypothetical protein
MTIPMVLGLGMTAYYLLTHLIKPKLLRKWLGVVLTLSGVLGLLKLSGLSGQALFALLITVRTGTTLILERAPSSKQKE